MKTLVIIFLLGLRFYVFGQDRELIYANKDNTLSLYDYANDKEFKYVIFYRNTHKSDPLGFEYLNFKSLNDLNFFLFHTIRSMKEAKSIHMMVWKRDLFIHGISKRKVILSCDNVMGCLNKSDLVELKTKIVEL